jgi:hypothetical protein
VVRNRAEPARTGKGGPDEEKGGPDGDRGGSDEGRRDRAQDGSRPAQTECDPILLVPPMMLVAEVYDV